MNIYIEFGLYKKQNFNIFLWIIRGDNKMLLFEMKVQEDVAYISREIEELAILVEPSRPLPAYNLQEQDAKAKYI
jgi:hypothetical protein